MYIKNAKFIEDFKVIENLQISMEAKVVDRNDFHKHVIIKNLKKVLTL